MNSLSALDTNIFFAINHLPHPYWADTVAMLLSGAGNTWIVWTLLLFVFVNKQWKKNNWVFRPLFFSAIASWLIVEIISKPFFSRIRPSNLEETNVIAEAHGFSFPSGHAAVAWALATVFVSAYPKYRIAIYVVATLICLSRMYLGVHYPSDILVGALIGWGIGTLVARRQLPQQFSRHQRS